MTKKDLIEALEKYDDDALVVVDVCNKTSMISLTPSTLCTSCLAFSIQIGKEETAKVKSLFESDY